MNLRRRARWLAQLVAVLAGGALFIAAASVLVGLALYGGLLVLT